MTNPFGGGPNTNAFLGLSGDAWRNIADAFQGAALIHQPGGAANLVYLQKMQEQRALQNRQRQQEAAIQKITQSMRPQSQDLSVGNSPAGSITGPIQQPGGFSNQQIGRAHV